MKPKSLTTLAALVLIGAGGFMAGRISSPASKTTEKETAAETRSSRSSSLASQGSSSASDTGKPSSRGSKSDRKEMATAEGRHARLESIIRGENPLDRNRALLAYLDQLAPGDFEEAVAYFRSLGITDVRSGEYSLLLTAWAQADPLAALTFAKENTQHGFTQDTILTTWATVDPEAALRWAQTQHTGEGPNPYLPGVIRGLAQLDPTRATELLASMPDSEERGKGLDFILPHLLMQGSAVTREWIGTITDDTLRNGAMVRAAEQLAKEDPAGTAAWLLANPGEATQRRIDDVYGTWMKNDPIGAIESLNKMPVGEARADALRGVIDAAASRSPQDAIALMDRYPTEVDDRIVQDFVQRTFNTDPATALNQIARVQDPKDQDKLYRNTLGDWLDKDAAAAQAWIAANHVPDATIERLNRRQEKRAQK